FCHANKTTTAAITAQLASRITCARPRPGEFASALSAIGELFYVFVSNCVHSWFKEHLNRHHDFGGDTAIISRLLSRERPHHRPVVAAFAGRAEFAFHQCRHEPVRADLSWPTKTAVESAARGRHAEMHSRRRQT